MGDVRYRPGPLAAPSWPRLVRDADGLLAGLDQRHRRGLRRRPPPAGGGPLRRGSGPGRPGGGGPARGDRDDNAGRQCQRRGRDDRGFALRPGPAPGESATNGPTVASGRPSAGSNWPVAPWAWSAWAGSARWWRPRRPGSACGCWPTTRSAGTDAPVSRRTGAGNVTMVDLAHAGGRVRLRLPARPPHRPDPGHGGPGLPGADEARRRPRQHGPGRAGQRGRPGLGARARPLRAAALDVLATEPPGPTTRSWRRPDVLVTPHMGPHTAEATSAMGAWALDDLLAVLSGRAPRYPI